VRTLAGVESKLSLQRPSQDTHAIAGSEAITSRKLDQTTTFPRADFSDDTVGNARGLDPIHDQANDADAPTGRVPLRLDGEEGISRKKRRPNLNPAAVRQTPLADPWEIRHVTSQAKAVERQPFPVRLEAGTSPIRHRSHRPQPVAIAGTRARIIGADGGQLPKLAGTVVPRAPVRLSAIGRRVPESSLQRTNQSVSRTNAAAAGGC
jgi:hypothetical protein